MRVECWLACNVVMVIPTFIKIRYFTRKLAVGSYTDAQRHASMFPCKVKTENDSLCISYSVARGQFDPVGGT